MKEAICDAQEMKAKIDKVQILAVDGWQQNVRLKIRSSLDKSALFYW